jgi:DNA polymerase-3 subunit delta
MPSIAHKSLEAYLAESQSADSEQAAGPSIPQTVLLYGEELLCRQALDRIVKAVIAAEHREFNYQPLEGSNEGIIDALERVATYSLSPGPKVVVLQDTPVFSSPKKTSDLFQKSFQLYQQNDMRRAAKRLIDYLSQKGISVEEAADEKWRSGQNLPEMAPNYEWLDILLQYSRDHKLKASASPGSARDMLKDAIQRGFPSQNHLIMTADTVDKRQSLFKAILETGLVVDCAVPKGDRKADRKVQEEVLRDHMHTILSRAGKRMAPEGFQLLVQFTGFDLRTFCQNLEKLVDYVGQRDVVQSEDVAAILKRTKKDPIYELTNAVADRRTSEALVFLNSLLTENYHPLQILAALVNQFRKLLLAKDFAQKAMGDTIRPDHINFYAFKADILPKMVAHDRFLLEIKQRWLSEAESSVSPSDKKPAKRKKEQKPKTDLVLVKSPNNPYPAYQLFQKAGKFSQKELWAAYAKLDAADQRLKSSGDNPRLILEEAVMQICGIRTA